MTDFTRSLPDVLVTKAIAEALEEDLGQAGDITTNAVIPSGSISQCAIVARRGGIIAGLQLAEAAFKALSPDIIFYKLIEDGDGIDTGEAIAEITGSGRALLSAERVALNFLCHLSGIATLTRAYVDGVAKTSAKICCTRKTTPGLRAFEKYAVAMGGGVNHRFGLYDAVMIKDNHIAIAGSLTEAVERARKNIGHLVKIEVEIDTLDQLEELLTCGADVVLLDNMSPDQLAEAVRVIDGRLITEASGGVSLDTVLAIAESGVDLISVGALTHSAPILDLGLDFVP